MSIPNMWVRKQRLLYILKIYLGSIICMLWGICEKKRLFIPKMYFYSSVFVLVFEDNPVKLKQLRPCCHEIIGMCVYLHIYR